MAVPLLEPHEAGVVFTVTTGKGLTTIFADAELLQPFKSVYEYTKLVDGPLYGLDTLNVPPDGVPDKVMGVPAHPLALLAFTEGWLFTVMEAGALVAIQPNPFITV